MKTEYVVLNSEWVRHCKYAPFKGYPKGRRAVVVGPSRTPECTRVIFDGNKTVATFHNSFLSPAPAPVEEQPLMTNAIAGEQYYASNLTRGVRVQS